MQRLLPVVTAQHQSYAFVLSVEAAASADAAVLCHIGVIYTASTPTYSLHNRAHTVVCVCKYTQITE
jgi:hypothetical protein